MLDGVGKLEYTSLDLSLVSNVDLLVVSANHGGLDLGSSYDGRKDTSRSIVSGETGFDHTGSVVYNEGSFLIFFSYFALVLKFGGISFEFIWLKSRLDLF